MIVGYRPVEIPAVDQRAADGHAVAAEKLGRRMHHYVGAMLDRAQQVRGCKRVVDEERDLRRMSDVGERFQVEHFKARIADRLGKDQSSFRPDGLAHRGVVPRIDEGGRDSEARKGQVQQVAAAAVQGAGGDDVIAGGQQGRDCQVERRLTARGTDTGDTPFECCKALFQGGNRRVGNAAVDVAGAFQVEQRRRVVGVFEDVARGLVDRLGAGSVLWVRALARMHSEGV